MENKVVLFGAGKDAEKLMEKYNDSEEYNKETDSNSEV